MKNLNFYLHRGPGHYVGSTIVVSAGNINDAETMIREILDNGGLYDEELNISLLTSLESKAIHVDLGDY
jgi:hypothetical protein